MDPDLRGKPRFRTPVTFPWKSSGASLSPRDRQISRCPLDVCEDWIWDALDTWDDWRAAGRPLLVGTSLAEQPARLMRALSILDGEIDVIHLAFREAAAGE